MPSRRLHLGCGTTVVPGWINVDGSWNARLARYPLVRKLLRRTSLIPNEVANVPWAGEIVHHDVRRPLPFATGSMSAVYASHLLEHLHRSEARALLREVLRVLEPGGIVRLVVPDLRAIVEQYVQSVQRGETADAESGLPPADLVNHRLLLRPAEPPRQSLAYRLYTALTDFHSHKWMYDADSLAHLMRDVGFAEVAQRGLFDSAIPDIEAIEQPSRVENGAGICLEGIKPRGVIAPRSTAERASERVPA